MIINFEYLLAVSLCTASISYTICYASIFKFFRELVSKIHIKVEELIHCPYCFSHYVILAIMFTTKNITSYLIPITQNNVYNFIFTWFCIVTITSLLHYIMLLAYRPIIEYMKERFLDKYNNKKH